MGSQPRTNTRWEEGSWAESHTSLGLPYSLLYIRGHVVTKSSLAGQSTPPEYQLRTWLALKLDRIGLN